MTIDELVTVENQSIRAFLQAHASRLGGHVLDYGCGRSPYRDIIEQADGDYVGYDRADFPASMSGTDVGPDFGDLPAGRFDAVVSTQTIQFHEEPYLLLLDLREMLRDGGSLLLTGPTNWPEVNPEDLFRFTQAGIGLMLRNAGFTIVANERRAVLDMGGFELAYGWGVVAES